MPTFYCFRYTGPTTYWANISVFSLFSSTAVWFEALARGYLRMKVVKDKNYSSGLLTGENSVILPYGCYFWLNILQRVTYRRTDT